ncbi:MAG: hypothetical protein ABFD89_30085 [Bryobacteraceae bacterium]
MNRARQQRLRDRRKEARNGVRNGVILDDNGMPNSSLQRVALNLAAGMSDRESLRKAGSSENALRLIDKAKAGLAVICQANGLTPEKVVKSIVEDFDAKERVIQPGGVCIERPHVALRPAARRDAIALLDRAGELPALQSNTQGGSQITVNIIRFEGQPPDVVSRAVDITPDDVSSENY